MADQGEGDWAVPPAAEVQATFVRLAAGRAKLSLNEVAQGVTELWPSFDDAPALMRAYRAADSAGDGWIAAADFQLLLSYLSFFHARWPAFNQLDEEHDGKIPVDALTATGADLGLEDAAIDSMSRQLDPDGRGWLAFEDLCTWAARSRHLGTPPQRPQAVGRVEAWVSEAPPPSVAPATNTVDDNASGDASLTESDGFASPLAVEEVASPPAQSAVSVAEAVERIKRELQLGASLEMMDAVDEAWAKLRLGGTEALVLKRKVARLAAELDIELGWTEPGLSSTE